MKKLLITTLLLCAWTMYSPAYSAVEMDYQSVGTMATPVGIERKLMINSDDDARYNIDIRPLSDCVQSSSGNYDIPLANFVINNNVQDIDFKDNEYSNIFSGITMNGVPRIVTAKIRDFGMVPMGTYNIPLQIQATDLDSAQITNSIFNLQFIVEKTQEMSVTKGMAKFQAGASNVLNKKARIINDSNTQIMINSNCDWVLVLKTDSQFGQTPGDFYVRTIGGTSNVTQRLQESVMLEEDKEIVLAKGKAPSNNERVTVQYSLANKDGKFIPAGHFTNKIKYVIREDRR